MKPSLWAGLIPNGIGQVQPNHYLDILKVAWRNRRQLPYALRILRKGVCDGCALGTTGMRDFTMSGVHLCTVRLNLLRLNTIQAMDHHVLARVADLRDKSSHELRELGRIPYPMLRRRGDAGFRRISWDEALDAIASRIRTSLPERLAFYLTSRGLSNEVYYVAQKAARFLGTNNVDNASRLCHAPSTRALKEVLGAGAASCSYKDWVGTDLLILFGSDVPGNQPVTTKYMYRAKQEGTKILVINPYKEPGLDRYWVPSVMESAVFGTKLADEFFQVHTGGDMAFINGVLKHLLENDWLDKQFIDDHTAGFEELQVVLSEQSWEFLEHESGASSAEMMRFARMYSEAHSAVFVWSMGITQHSFGTQNVKGIVNLALSRGMLGREKCGVMPIRGHSGVQGGGELGCLPDSLPGSRAMNAGSAAEIEPLWGFPVPQTPGLSAVEMIDAAHDGELDVFHVVCGNFLETLPEPDYVREALERVPLRIHQDLVVTHQMLVDPADMVILLPAATRYEQSGGATETSTERYIYFSPEIPGRRIGEARSEWQILMDLAEQVHPERHASMHFENGDQIRAEIAQVVPSYGGIEDFGKAGDAVQWGGPRLYEGGVFGTPEKLGHFTEVSPAATNLPPGRFKVSTRRRKQFNSMVWDWKDPLTGANQNDILMNPEDATSLDVEDGAPLVLESEIGSFRGVVKESPILPGNLQIHWPEGMQLIGLKGVDLESGIPDYNVVVSVTVPKDREASL